MHCLQGLGVGTVPAVSGCLHQAVGILERKKATRTINVDNPWHKTQSFGRISTQALERGRDWPQPHT